MDSSPAPLTPEPRLDTLFASMAARDGQVDRRKSHDIERYAGWALFRAEIEQRATAQLRMPGRSQCSATWTRSDLCS